MNRKQRRALAHHERKVARKLGFPPSVPEPQPETTPPPSPTGITPEPEPSAPSEPSLARLAANRANAQLSTGPKSESGLAISSQNRATHGLARHNGAFRFLPTEDPAGFEALKSSLAAEHQPETESEGILVNKMAESHWLANRAQNLQDDCFEPATNQITDRALFSLYMRYHSTHSRAFHKSLNDLLKLRKERRAEQNGFEAQQRQTQQHLAKTEKLEMKKQHHSLDVSLKHFKVCHQITLNLAAQTRAAKEDDGFFAKYAAELAANGLEEHPSSANFAAAA